jgi:polyisoprenoid-binding protein YceI
MSSDASPPEEPAARPLYRRRWFIVTTIAVVVLVAAAIGGIWWYLRDDAPEAVNLESAAGQLTTTTAAGTTPPATDAAAPGTTIPAADGTADPATTAAADTAATTAASSPAAAVSGTWAVDTSIGEFSFEDSTGTFVGFRIDEELSGIGDTTAVGRTPAVTGTITFDGTTLASAAIDADMSAITTNDSRRDDRVQDALETDQFPTATFSLTQPIDLGEAVTTGAPVAVDATGDLTIHGVATPVTLPIEAQLVGDTIVVVGSLPIELSTYGVEAPSAPIVVSVSDQATIELQLFFSAA